MTVASALALASPRARLRAERGLGLLDGMDLPRAGVVEFAAPAGLGRATRLALCCCAVAQAEARAISHDGDTRWCGWLDPGASLYAPAVIEAGVDPARLLVVRPEVEDLAKIAVRMAASRVFAVLVIDRVGVPGARIADRRIRWDLAVRRLALACESSDTTVLLLSELEQARQAPLPVAMRIEITRPSADRLYLRVVKDRRGIEGSARVVALGA
jgi:recombination protein RecA